MISNVSVIVPVYNTKKYLQQAIDSLLVQKDFIWEIIIIDDGSTDGSGELIEKLYGNNNSIKIFHTENQGQGPARNLGTINSTGEFIYYFDSDDIVNSNLFKQFHEIILRNPTLELFCFSGQSFLDQDTSAEKISNKQLFSDSSYKRKLNTFCDSGETAFNLLIKNKGFFPGPPFYIFKKNVLLVNNIKFNPIRYEDEEFTHKLFLFAGKTFITNNIYFKRRVRAGSTMQSSGKFLDISGYFEIVESLSNLKNLDFIAEETKKTLDERILTFLKLIIEIKTIKKIPLTNQEYNSYKSFLKPYLQKNLDLMVYYYKFPFEYKLRAFKKRIFN